MRRVVVVGAALGVVLAAGAVRAVAAPVPVLIDNRAPELATRAGGGWTADLGLTNLTDGDVKVAVVPTDAKGCRTLLGTPRSLPPAEHTVVTVVVPSRCKVDTTGIHFKVTATAAGVAGEPLAVTAVPAPPSPEWNALWAFPVVLGFGCVVSMVGLLLAWLRGNLRCRSLLRPLTHLGKSWDFTESWASNVTAIGGLLTVFFTTSGVTKALLGEDADQAIALATVGSAIAIALAAAAPVVLHATAKMKKADDMQDVPTVYGLVVAAIITSAAAAGELWIGYSTGTKLDLGGVQNRLWIPALLAAALLLVYVCRTLYYAITQGDKRPSAARIATTGRTRRRTALL